MIIISDDKVDYVDRNSRGQVVRPSSPSSGPAPPRYSQEGHTIVRDEEGNILNPPLSPAGSDDDSLNEVVVMRQTGGPSPIAPLLPIHAPSARARPRSTSTPYDPASRTTLAGSSVSLDSDRPLLPLRPPVPDAVAKRRARRRFWTALAWALVAYVAVGAILAPILEKYLNQKDNTRDDTRPLLPPYQLSANHTFSTQLALTGSSELVLLPAAGTIHLHLPSTVSGTVRIERAPTDKAPSVNVTETTFWASFTLPQSVNAVLAKHSDSLIAHLLVPLQPLQLVLPLQPPDSVTEESDDSDAASDATDTSSRSTTTLPTEDKRRRRRRRQHHTHSLSPRHESSTLRKRIYHIPNPSSSSSSVSSYASYLFLSPRARRLARSALVPLLTPVGGFPRWTGLSTRSPFSSSSSSPPTSSGGTLQKRKPQQYGEIEFAPGADQPTAWASLVVASKYANGTNSNLGVDISVDDPSANGTSYVDISPSCPNASTTDCAANTEITLYLPADQPDIDLTLTSEGAALAVSLADLTDVALSKVDFNIDRGNIAVEKLNATTIDMHTSNGTVSGSFLTPSHLTLYSSSLTNATITVLSHPVYAAGAFLGLYTSEGAAYGRLVSTASRDDVRVNLSGWSSNLSVPSGYQGDYEVSSTLGSWEGGPGTVRVGTVGGQDICVKQGPGSIQSAENPQGWVFTPGSS